MMDAVFDPANEQVIFQTSSQVGKTEILNNILGWTIHLSPCPILVVQPTLDMARAWASDRLEPMARDTPVLADRVRTGRTKAGRSSQTHKTFPGGHVSVVGANAPASLASRPIRMALCDEVDRFPASAGEEGDPVDLVVKRTTTFHNRRILLVSTPTVRDQSRIELAYQQSDRRIFEVPCPSCGAFQRLRWAQIRFENDDPTTTRYQCAHCGDLLAEPAKRGMLEGGRWLARNPERRGMAGFHLSELYSPWSSWARVVEAFLKAKGNPAKLRVWTNTSLGETWDEGRRIEGSAIAKRAEPYALIPAEVQFVTAGVDVQNDRLEAFSRGWGPGRESWAIEHRIFPGDPKQPEVWARLEEWRRAPIEAEDGAQLFIGTLCVDSGHLASFVYDYCAPRYSSRVYATKGRGGFDLPVAYRRSRRKKEPERCPVFTIGADAAKDVFFDNLKIESPGPGFVHYHQRLDLEFFEQVTSEVKRQTFERGRLAVRYAKVRERNEALDLEVLNIAALHITQPRLIGLARPPRPAPKPQLAFELPGAEPAAEAVAKPGVRQRRAKRDGKWSLT